MADLKSLKIRIKTVRSTQKITKAMKVISAAKLRKARNRLTMSYEYNNKLKKISSAVMNSLGIRPEVHKMLEPADDAKVQLMIIVTSDRGLCGAFNGALYRRVRQDIAKLEQQGKIVKLFLVGKKGYDLFKHNYSDKIVMRIDGPHHHSYHYNYAETIYDYVEDKFLDGEIPLCHIYYNKFVSALVQLVTCETILPLPIAELTHQETSGSEEDRYDFEPNKHDLLAEILPMIISMKIFHALLESSTSEHAARMAAMDAATRNSEKMIRKLTLLYNRTRQANITRELIEIISGAEAV